MPSDSPTEFGKWPYWVFRFIGIVNLGFICVGLLFMSGSVRGVMAGRVVGDHTPPYLLQAFWTMTAMNFVLLACLALGSIRLLQLKMQGVKICSLAFAAEILYFIVVAILWFSPSTAFSMSIAGATGIGEMGIAPQLITGYPLIAVGVLNLAGRRFRSAASGRLAH